MLATNRPLWDVFVQFPDGETLNQVVGANERNAVCREIRVTGRRLECGTRFGWFGALFTYPTRAEAESMSLQALSLGGDYFVGPYPRYNQVQVTV